MSDEKNESSSPNSVGEAHKFSVSPTSSQPFIFRQYTVREIVTPTKQGNFALREVFSIWGGGWFQTPSENKKNISSILNFSPSTNCHLSKSPERDFIPISNKPHWTSSSKTQTSECTKNMFWTPDRSSTTRSRNKSIPPFKKVKVNSLNGHQKKHVGHPQSSKSSRLHDQAKDIPRLHLKYMLIIALLPLLVITGIFYCISPVYEEVIIKSEGKFQPLRKILNDRVFGQEEALTSLVNVIEGYSSKGSGVDMPVILMTGPSGVGKSFTSSLIVNYFPPPGKAELVLSSPPPPPKLILKKFSERGLNVVVVDCLDPLLLQDTIMWVQNLFNEAMWQNKPVLSVLIFNDQVWKDELTTKTEASLHESDVKDKLINRLMSSGFSFHHIHFNYLSKENVESCIQVALKKQGIHDNFRTAKYVDVISGNVNFREEGCKSVWSRTATASFD